MLLIFSVRVVLRRDVEHDVDVEQRLEVRAAAAGDVDRVDVAADQREHLGRLQPPVRVGAEQRAAVRRRVARQVALVDREVDELDVVERRGPRGAACCRSRAARSRARSRSGRSRAAASAEPAALQVGRARDAAAAAARRSPGTARPTTGRSGARRRRASGSRSAGCCRPGGTTPPACGRSATRARRGRRSTRSEATAIPSGANSSSSQPCAMARLDAVGTGQRVYQSSATAGSGQGHRDVLLRGSGTVRRPRRGSGRARAG